MCAYSANISTFAVGNKTTMKTSLITFAILTAQTATAQYIPTHARQPGTERGS